VFRRARTAREEKARKSVGRQSGLVAYTYRRSKYAHLVRGESVGCFATHVLREKNKRGSPWGGRVGWWHIRTAEASTRIKSVEKAWGVSPRTYCARRISEEVCAEAEWAGGIYVPQKQVRALSPWRRRGVFRRARTAREK